MKKETLNEKIAAMEKELAAMKLEVNQPEISNTEKAREWLFNFLNENDGKFEIQVKKDTHTYYRNGQWLFQLDLKNNNLWVYYYSTWLILQTKYSLNYNEIQQLIKDVVGEAFNCKGFTAFYVIKESLYGTRNFEY